MRLFVLLATLAWAGAPQLPAQAVNFTTEDVRYSNRGTPLAALLLKPATSGRHAAAVIIQGSGKSDRPNQWARMVAEMMTGQGVLVLLTDKRGSGASGGDWLKADFHDLADDALAGVALLAARSDVDPKRIGLIGLSQGGWVAPIAAAKNGDVAFVVTIGSAAVTYVEQSHHEMANTARQAGLPEESVQEVVELNRLAVQYTLGRDWAPYDLTRSRGLGSSWSWIARGYPDTPDSPIWDWLRMVGFFDPIPYWKRVRQPALVVYGEEDERDNVPVTESVLRLEAVFGVAGRQDHRVLVIPGVGHSLIDHAKQDFAAEFVDALRDWLTRQSRGS